MSGRCPAAAKPAPPFPELFYGGLVGVYKTSVDVYKGFGEFYRSSVEFYKGLVEFYRGSVEFYKTFVDVYKGSVELSNNAGETSGGDFVLFFYLRGGLS
jgi:hypothetical protein